MDLQIIFDADLEVGTVIDMDTRMALPVAMVGPNATDVIQAFIDSIPFDMEVMPYDVLAAAWASFLGQLAQRGEPASEAVSPPPQGDMGSPGLDGAALAEAVARESADEPPAPAPADSDMEADASPPLQVMPCFNCNGEGVLHFGDGSADQRCNMCGGTGKIQMAPAT